MLVISNRAYTILKIVYITLMIRLQIHKSSPMHYGLWGKIFRAYFNIFICTKYNEINIGHSDVQKHVS